LPRGGRGRGAGAGGGWRGPRRARGPVLAGALVLSALRETVRVVPGSYYQAARLTRAFGLGQSLLLFPSGAADYLQTEAPAARVLNDDVLGGFLLWRPAPPLPVFLSRRAPRLP